MALENVDKLTEEDITLHDALLDVLPENIQDSLADKVEEMEKAGESRERIVKTMLETALDWYSQW